MCTRESTLVLRCSGAVIDEKIIDHELIVLRQCSTLIHYLGRGDSCVYSVTLIQYLRV